MAAGALDYYKIKKTTTPTAAAHDDWQQVATSLNQLYLDENHMDVVMRCWWTATRCYLQRREYRSMGNSRFVHTHAS